MINLRYFILLAYFAMCPAIAAEAPASETSVREQLSITQSQKLLDGTMGHGRCHDAAFHDAWRLQARR
ncbi:MAG: hypothetical protein HY018_04690 [Hydrogenophilales bacterium]|nr:hypothetical protein [Hydrogenophilales bacterium]